jgi:hypothetical protein
MHQKLTIHERFCKQNNQLPTKSHDELEDNSNDQPWCGHGINVHDVKMMLRNQRPDQVNMHYRP